MIEIQNITKKYENHILFNHFSQKIEDGSFTIIFGESGTGKTTLLNMIGALETVDEGKIIVNGMDITKKRVQKKYWRQNVGFLFQNFALVENKTVSENLNMIHRQARSKVSIEEALKRVGMQGKEKQKVFSLSGGEQQRVALARLMMKQCTLILADEPTGSLDRNNALKVMKILDSFTEEGKTVIMVTHDQTLIKDTMQIITL